ncbi:related to TWF1-twinfilin, an actin monomer sequestering protein [Ramularia collo-cygni]|uniref:Related to TWF1-twinfilin, an actin monomer sequestering protein n=1 Tax=Ramularia collo-cygni TaxID=112498 RepID=A0A2D3UNQ2_9PEZI|nr:related to TWF1-twinfilin, an actin monomer sequestering protein [Ramularia collo-cygni]CZT15168.1 related to TWF1-twinfilin, an actin monomer sequestering protein [Ramularia collo-cygni]
MQSGISASQELQSTFNAFVSDPSQRFLLVSISNETLIPHLTIPSTASDFKSDLSQLSTHLTPTTTLYIIIKSAPEAADGYIAVTYVPNTAPVRQKMLFASTRLTLVRELGIERFRETLFVTEAKELTREGWEAHERHEKLEAPLTEEERGSQGVREAEMIESGGTGGRKGYVRQGAGVELDVGEGVLAALRSVKEERGRLVQLGFRLPDEKLVLEGDESGVQAQDVAGKLSTAEPRYSFYSAEGEDGVVFIYTCPTASKIKERMVYSTGKSWTRTFAERDVGIVVGRSLEGTEPEDITAELVGGNAAEEGVAELKPSTSGFARPKRPGRR